MANTFNRRRKSRVCHVNMLKHYVTRSDVLNVAAVAAAVTSVNASLSDYTPESDDLKIRSASFLTARLLNSKTLKDLSTKLSHLPLSTQADLSSFSKYPTLFNDFPLTTHVTEHDIDVGSHIPVKQNAYRVNPIKRDLMKHETQYLLEHGLAVPSSSPWCSQCLLVPKSDGISRFCTDYRKVNALTKPDSFPLPHVEDCVDRVGNSKFVTKLDLLKGYWQVPLTNGAFPLHGTVRFTFGGFSTGYCTWYLILF